MRTPAVVEFPSHPYTRINLQPIDKPHMLPPCSPALISIWVVVAELLQRVAAGGLQGHHSAAAAAATANSSTSACSN
jgi:hypothetical protein